MTEDVKKAGHATPASAVRARPDGFLNERLDWNLLRTFLAIARERSVSRAAARLHLTQPAVSQALRRLEEQLGRRLVDRHGPRIELTQAGINVQQIAEEVYGMVSRLAVSEDSNTPDVSGLVRVAMVTGIVFAEYDDFLATFHRCYPRIEIETQEMRSADVVASLQQKSATLGLSPRRALPKKVQSRIFMRQRYALYCGRYHHLFAQKEITLSDLLAEPFVSFSGDRVGDHLSPLTIFRDEMGLTERVVASSASVAEVKRLIYTGFGIGPLPTHLMQTEIAQGRFRQLPPEEGVADLDIHLLWASDQKLSSAERVFIEALQHWLNERDSGAACAA